MRIQPQNIICTLVTIVLTPFLWMIVFPGNDLTEVDLLEKHLAELRDRLHYAESLNREREHDMLSLRNQIKLMLDVRKQNNMTLMFMRNAYEKSNASSISDRSMDDDALPKMARDLLANMSLLSSSHVDMSIPNMFHYLPHLIGKPDSIMPAVKYSQGRAGVSIVIGIPTIKRVQESYLSKTLQSLIDSLNEDERLDVLLVVLVAEADDADYVKATVNDIIFKFSDAMNAGLLEVIAPSRDFYPNMNELKDRFGDTMERVKWRTKQNLDYTFLMMYARSRGTYYVQLEDDVISKPGYVTIMKNFALNQKLNDWLLLEFSHLGFIGKLFKSTDLPFIVEFFLMFHKDKPVDWLLDHLLYVKVCNPEKDNKHCQRSVADVRRRYKPSLFQHIGTYSSLKGKVQKLKDKDFGKGVMHRPHLNPNAEVSTSLRVYDQYSLDRAYMGEVFFWGVLPQYGDTVTIKFIPPVVVEKYLFRSGNPEHPGDRFYNTTIEVLLSQFGKVLDNSKPVTDYPQADNGFYIINRFDGDSGLVEGIMPASFGLIDTMRLFVQSPSQSWVILSEIFIKEKSKSSTT